jgi:hypothetical protein
MSDKKVFKCMAGLVQLEKVYWHDSSDAQKNNLANKISLYSDEKRRMPIYMHLRVSDLFLCAGTATQRVQKGTKIVIDILALTKDDIVKQKDANNISVVKDSVQPFAECILDLEPGGKTIVEGSNKSVVSGFSTDKKELVVTKIYGRKGSNGEIAYTYDLCFEVQFTDEQYKTLFDKKNKNRYLFAWAWTINKTTISEYESVSKVSIDSAGKRLDFLKQGEQSYIVSAIDYYKEMLLSSSNLPRHQYGTAAFVDNFPFDEPSYNFLKVENALPFTFFGVGAQFGPIGLCRKDSEYHKKYISKYPDSEDFIVKEGKPLRNAAETELYLDEPCGEKEGAAQFGHGLLSDQGEYHSFGDQCFLFKKDSAALKINSIESETGDIHFVKELSKVLPFKSGKCELVFHDYISDYRDKFKDVGLQRFDIVMEQKEVDFSGFETLLIAPNDSLKFKLDESSKSDGELVALIDTTIPGYGSIGTCHTDVKLRGREQKNPSQQWEAHTLVHRPLIFMYELERDLTDDEKKVLEATPITCTLKFGNVGRFKDTKYKIPIDTKNGIKKGKHAILVYIVTNQPRLEVIITDDSLVPAVDRIAGYGDKIEYRGFNWPLSWLPSITLYKNNRNSGLFKDNPMVIVDDFSWSEIAVKNNKSYRASSEKAVVSKSFGFFLDFIPYVGGIAASAWDVGVDIVDGNSIDDATKISIVKDAMHLFFDCLDISDPKNNPDKMVYDPDNVKFSGAKESTGKVLNFYAMVAAIDQTVKGYYDSVATTSSQFLRGVEFGKGEKDSLYLMAVNAIQMTPDSKTLLYKHASQNTIEIFMNRELTGDEHQPFNVQFGATSGLLQRDNEKETVTDFRDSYLQKVSLFQEILEMDTKDTPVGEYLVKQAQRNAGTVNLMEKFKKGKMNKKFIEALESKNVCDALEKKANGGSLTKANAEMLCLIINLLRYVDVFFVTCPVCKHIVSLSWGWCPYHGTMEELKLKDVDGDGRFDDGFKQYLIKNSFDKKYFLDAYQEVITNEKPLFVHWTQFRISRGRG